MKRAIWLLFVAAVAVAASAQLTGQWTGSLKLPGASLRLNLNFTTDDAGALAATLDSPDQNAYGIECDKATLAEGRVEVSVGKIGASYSGTVQADSIVGTFAQGTAKMPLTLRRVAVPSKRAEREQTPRPPFPYEVSEVKFANPAGGMTLAGTLTMPKEARNVPAVVMITGSGPQNRDEEIMGHCPFAVIADHLTRQGIAVLRYDDRGTGSSGGNFATATTTTLATDARAAFDYLATQPGIDKKRMGYIGHSEGGTIAFLNASTDKRVAFVVALAAPTMKGSEILTRQNEMIYEAATGSALPATIRQQVVDMFAAIERSTSAEALRGELRQILKADGVPAAQRGNVEQQIAAACTPWYIEFVKTDPTAALRALRCPILALGGSLDVQVDARACLARITKLCGKKRVTTKEYPGLNHLFQPCDSSQAGLNYGAIEQTIAPEVLSDISSWILGR